MGNPTWGDGKRVGSEKWDDEIQQIVIDAAINDDAAIVSYVILIHI